MNLEQDQRQLGPLQCTIVDGPDAQEQLDLIVVFCHGFGAPGTDLVGLAPELIEQLGDAGRNVRFYFPQAPLSLESVGLPFGRAWWMLDMEKLQLAAEGKLTRDQRNETPEGLVEARRAMNEFLQAIKQETGLDESKIVLGGFSQGSMIATDLALRLDVCPAALVIWSGTLLCEAEWRELATKRGTLKVLQSHGRSDPILPFAAAEDLQELLKSSGCEAEFVAFGGPHTIPMEAIDRSVELLRDLRKKGSSD